MDAGAARSGSPPTSARRYDPHRRDRIIDACLDVVAEVGVAGTSHRRVAEAADVPLGSMTYHFSGMQELLQVAFSRFAEARSAEFARRMSGASDVGLLEQAVSDAITGGIVSSQRDMVLTHELYTLAARDPAYRAITHAWMGRSRQILERVVDPATARIVDALIEGLSIHRALDIEPPDDSVVRTALRRVLGGARRGGATACQARR